MLKDEWTDVIARMSPEQREAVNIAMEAYWFHVRLEKTGIFEPSQALEICCNNKFPRENYLGVFYAQCN